MLSFMNVWKSMTGSQLGQRTRIFTYTNDRYSGMNPQGAGTATPLNQV